MTVSRKSKQVKNNATRKNEKSKRKTIKKYSKKSKNVTLKLRQSGGGPIEFIQWVFSKLLELFTFNKNNRGNRKYAKTPYSTQYMSEHQNFFNEVELLRKNRKALQQAHKDGFNTLGIR